MRPHPSLWKSVGVSCLLSLVLDSACLAQEYEMKGAYIYNFLKFLRFPVQAAVDISVCALSHEPLLPGFEKLTDRTVQSARLRAIILRELGDEECGVVYFHDSYRGNVRGVLGKLAGKAVLTIGENDGFLDDGGMITFYYEDQRIRFDVSLSALKRENIVASSQLLKLAREVRE
jgi:hypothetical protein